MRSVLFVDDEPSVLNGYRRILNGEARHWQMHFFDTARALLDHLRVHGADLVVTDVKMPGIDGLELLAILSAPEWGGIPVVVVTGVVEQGLKRRALDLGAFDLLNKPVDPEDLIARLRNVLRVRHYQEELQRQNEVLEDRVRERTRDLVDSQREVVLRLARAAEYRDQETGNHVLRVSHFGQPVARNLGMDSESRERFFLTSALHDLGKIGIPDRVLLKPGRLDAEEWAIVKRHCAIGAGILTADHPVVHGLASGIPEPAPQGPNPFLLEAATIALSHHERWDGGGYPHGLAGEEIPLAARIVTLVDVYDALTSRRLYRGAMEEAAALAIIQEGVGTQFDPRVHEAFLASLGDIRQIQADLGDPIR